MDAGHHSTSKALRGHRRRRERQERAIYWWWAAELYETPALAERVKEALPSEMVTNFEARPLRRPG